MSPKISVDLTEKEYKQLLELRGSQTWREYILELSEIDYTLRKIGRPKTTEDKKTEPPTPKPKEKTKDKPTPPKKTEKPSELWKCCERCDYKTKNWQETTCPKCNGHLRVA